MRFVKVASCFVSLALLAGCASKKEKVDPGARVLTSYAPAKKEPVKKTKLAVLFPKSEEKSQLSRKKSEPKSPKFSGIPSGKLAGRTLYASSVGDIRLKPGEIILTFDDGPVPGKTNQILNTLSSYGVKATFLMVGSMANSYPSHVRTVVSRGHSIGSHTSDHANLRNVSLASAKAKIRAGEKAISKATGRGPAPFFRFPYLAGTPALRSWLAQRGVVVLDVDIDSKDYFKDSPTTIVNRTMARLRARGSGIILFHDIHSRSVAALPLLLKELKAGGYKVVALKSGNRPTTDDPVLVSNNTQ